MTSKIVVNNIEADTGVSTVTFNSNIQGNFVGNVNTTGVSTFSNIRVTGGTISGVSTAGITTAYITQLIGVGAGTSIQIPTGSRLVGLTTGSVYAPGTIIQVVQVRTTTQSVNANVTTNTTFDLLSATITPTSSSSRILILSSFQIWMQNGTSVVIYGRGHLRRGTTDLYSAPSAENVVGSVGEWGHRHNVQWLDSPNTTSEITYTFRWTHDQPSPITNLVFNRNSSPGLLTLIEISGG